jgi:hypothetical protein
MKAANPTQVDDAGGPVERIEHQAHALAKFRSDSA